MIRIPPDISNVLYPCMYSGVLVKCDHRYQALIMIREGYFDKEVTKESPEANVEGPGLLHENTKRDLDCRRPRMP